MEKPHKIMINNHIRQLWLSINLSDRYFCYYTAAMFVSLPMAQTWRLHTKLYKFGWYTSATNARMKNSRNLILGKVVYISIIYHTCISDSWLFSPHGYDFYFDHMTGENREYKSLYFCARSINYVHRSTAGSLSGWLFLLSIILSNLDKRTTRPCPRNVASACGCGSL